MTLTTTPNSQPSLDSQILKTDCFGRVRTPKARREALLAEFDASGLSAAKFSALVGIKYTTLANWIQKRRKRSGLASSSSGLPVAKVSKNAPCSKPPAQLHWIEARFSDKPSSPTGCPGSGLKVHLQHLGICLEVSDTHQAALAAALICALEKNTQC